MTGKIADLAGWRVICAISVADDGTDWVNPVLVKCSVEIMVTEVMPRVNKALGR